MNTCNVAKIRIGEEKGLNSQESFCLSTLNFFPELLVKTWHNRNLSNKKVKIKIRLMLKCLPPQISFSLTISQYTDKEKLVCTYNFSAPPGCKNHEH